MSCYSSSHGKQWTSPEVRGTVGLPWPAIVDGLYNHTPLNHPMSFNSSSINHSPANPHSSFTSLHQESLKRYPSPHEQLHRGNLNSSHEFLQHVQAATSYMNYGTPLHRPYREQQLNGSVSFDNSRRYNEHNSIHSSVSSELGREHSSGSSSSLRNRSNLSIDQTSNSKTNIYEHSKVSSRAEKKAEETATSPNHNQSEEEKVGNDNGWQDSDRGPLYFQHTEPQITVHGLQ